MKQYRYIQLILYCLEKDGFVSLDELSKQLQVSVATIRLDLDEVEAELKNYHLKLLRKRGVGYLVEGTFADKSYAYQKLMDKQQAFNLEKGYELNYYLLSLLIQNVNQYIRIRDLASKLFVSESVVQKKLGEIKKQLADGDVQLESIKNKGIRLCGSEKNIRRLYSKLMNPNKNQSLNSQKDVKSQIFELLHIQPEAIFIAIRKCEKELNQSFSDESVNSLAIHIAIAVKRVFEGKSVPAQELVDIHDFEKEYEAAIHIKEEILNFYHVNFNDHEIYYMFLHLISAKVLKDEGLFVELKQIDEKDKAVLIAEGIISLVSSIKQISIDKKYQDNLIIHLRPTINRLEYGMELTNPLLNEIKKEYPEAYGIAWMCNSIFLRIIQKDMSEDEAGFIAIHIQTMIESCFDNVKAVLVCSSGIGISQLLATQIEKRFKRIRIIGIESIASYQKKRFDAHCVISTFPIQSELPLLLVNPLLTDYDIQQINDFIAHSSIKGKKPYLEIRTCIKQHFEDQGHLISSISNDLLNQGYVTSAFSSSVIEREKLNSTAIGMKTALPHAEFETVRKSCVVLVTLRDEILWGEDWVDLVLFVIIKKEELAGVELQLRNLYRKLYLKQTHEELINADDEKQILSLLQ